jgi:hypothetical protein
MGVWGYGRIWCESALAHHRAGRCNLKGKTHIHTHTHTHTQRPIINKAVGRNGGLLLPWTGHGQAGIVDKLFQGSSQIERCCQCRVEDPGDSPGGNYLGNLGRVQYTFYAAELQTDMFPTPSRRIGTKRNKTNLPDVIAWLNLGAEKYLPR